ncbi:hypothetical protein KR100_13270 [Synechococcus sp. KORDI-100]|nr:hypothetical protein KR100_13270 [Synechococcus sp. KORDI-100]
MKPLAVISRLRKMETVIPYPIQTEVHVQGNSLLA